MKLICNYCGSDTMEVCHSGGCLVLQIEQLKDKNAALKRENDNLKLALETTRALMKDVY